MTQTSPQNSPKKTLNENGKTPRNGKLNGNQPNGNQPNGNQVYIPATIESEFKQEEHLSNSNNSNSSLPTSDNKGGLLGEWQDKTLKEKTGILAMLISFVPVAIIGTLAYFIVGGSLRNQIVIQEKSQVANLSEEINLLMSDRIEDVRVMKSSLQDLVASTEGYNSPTITNTLQKWKGIYGYYDNIVILDNKGNVVTQTDSTESSDNQFTSEYIQQVTQTKSAVVSQPVIAEDGSGVYIFVADQLVNPSTGKVEGYISARIPKQNIKRVLTSYQNQENAQNYYLIDSRNNVFISSQPQISGQNTLNRIIDIFPQLENNLQDNDSIETKNSLTNQKQIISYDKISNSALNNLNWSALIAQDSSLVFAPLKNLLTTLFVGGLILSALAAYISYLLAQKLLKPLEKTTQTIKKIGEGDLDTLIEVQGNDEIASIGKNINKMTFDLKTLLQQQQTFANQSSLLKNITLAMTQAFDENEVFGIAVREIRQALQSDRVGVYQFDENWQGVFIAESVDNRFPQALGEKIYDPCFADKYVEKYTQGRVQATPDVYKAGLTDCHLQQLEPFQVKANLVAPIITEGKLLGLLIAHQCSSTRNWEDNEIDFFGQTATQIGPALERAMLVRTQQIDSYLSQRLKDITFKITECSNKDQVFEVATEQGRQDIKVDRVMVYTFDEDWKGKIIAESVDMQYPQALGSSIKDPCFAEKYVEQYVQGRVQATNNIYTAGLTDCHIKQLEPFQVKANLVTPIIVEGNLLGLLIAHQCDAPRKWTASESNYLAQLATQIGPALERIQLLEKQQKSELEQRQAREKMQQRALELLMQVDPVSQGDLTIRANVTEDEIGTIADSYNATIENLRKIVTQVQGGTQAVTDTVNEQEAFVGNLATEVVRQADDINIALEKIQTLAYSARLVLDNAEQAEQAVQQANKSVEDGEVAMNRTVDGILAIRETVAETAKKVKRLGESTQKISKVVNLISSFADQTNLLALNASIEAAHAGEEGRGFAVVADEVRSLARQSAEATAEIEKVVAEIQTETNDVVKAMESGTEQVVEGTRLVEETRDSLNQITSVSAQINQLVTSISMAAAEQSQTSEDITETMADVANISNETAEAVNQVSHTFRKLLRVAENLQYSVSKFKVK